MPDWAAAGAGRGESESDRAGAFQAHARRTWIGAKPIRAGAGQDVSESDGAGARHTADQARAGPADPCPSCQTEQLAWAGAGRPMVTPVFLGRVMTAVRQEATSKDEGLSPDGPAQRARTQMDS